MGKWPKRLRALANLALIAAAIAGAVVAGLHWHRDRAARQAYDQLQVEVDSTLEKHPQCRDYAALLATRAHGPSGWKHVDAAMTAAEQLENDDTPVRRLLDETSELGWRPDPRDVALAPEFLAATEHVVGHIRQALAAPCIVAEVTDPDPPIPFRSLPMESVRRVLFARLHLLAATSDLDRARVELVEWVTFAQRMNMAGTIFGWVGQQLLRKDAWLLAAELVPMLDCDSQYLAALGATKPARDSDIARALEAELALMVWACRVWVLDHDPKVFGGEFKSTAFGSGADYLLSYSHGGRQYDALCAAFRSADSALDADAARAAVDGLASVGAKPVWSSLDEASVRHWCQLDLELLAARLAFDLRVLEHQGNLASQRVQAARLVPNELKLLWHEDRVEVVPNPGAAIVKFCAVPLNEPLCEVSFARK